MGARGPKPKNPALKLLAGNPGKRPVQRSRSGRIRKGAPVRPPELTGEAAAEWDWQVTELGAAGMLAVTDRGILAAYCLASSFKGHGSVAWEFLSSRFSST